MYLIAEVFYGLAAAGKGLADYTIAHEFIFILMHKEGFAADARSGG